MERKKFCDQIISNNLIEISVQVNFKEFLSHRMLNYHIIDNTSFGKRWTHDGINMVFKISNLGIKWIQIF
jgi:hypothetical protein